MEDMISLLAQYGLLLVFAKFVPGCSTVAPPIAGAVAVDIAAPQLHVGDVSPAC